MFRNLLEDAKKMKFVIFLLLISWQFLSLGSEWIQPPNFSNKGYPVPSADYTPQLPKDHGAHQTYGLEWWYWIGHLQTVDGEKKFGFQSTVFRLAGAPGDSTVSNESRFGKRQLYLAHSALSDVSNQHYIHHERVLREGWQARVGINSLSIKVGGIEANMLEDGRGHFLTTRYPDGGQLELELFPLKPIVRFGDRGLSRKGDDPESVSWYWTYTRLQAKGKLIHKGREMEVKGEAWMDHEISSSQLGQGLTGWDWTCMQLNDGTEVKAYRLRKEDGSSDRWSSFYWIDQEGNTEQVYANEFSWIEKSEWTSPKTGLIYPTTVKISVNHPKRGKQTYLLEPLIKNQEFYGNQADNAYWEGACKVMDDQGNTIGKAYLELAGYGGGLGARLN